MNINDTVTQLIEREGGYSNDPADAGGETMYGITVAVARKHGYDGPMSMMPRSTAVAIYKAEYWFGPQFDKVAMMNQRISEELLDTGVNMGVSWAVGFLQRALNACNAQGSMYDDVTVDKNIGPKTLAALGAFLQIRGTGGINVMMRLLNGQQAVRYLDISEAKETNEKFTYGWILNRVE